MPPENNVKKYLLKKFNDKNKVLFIVPNSFTEITSYEETPGIFTKVYTLSYMFRFGYIESTNNYKTAAKIVNGSDLVIGLKYYIPGDFRRILGFAND